MPAVDPAAWRLDDTFRDLRALHIGAGADLFRYLGLDGIRGKHLIQISAPGRRPHGHILRRGDPRHWVEGLILAQGDPATVAAILNLDRERSPELLLVAEAAARIPSVDVHGNRRLHSQTPRRIVYTGTEYVPIGPAAIEALVRKGTLYPMYGPDGARRLFAAQVDAEAAARHALHLTTVAEAAAAGRKHHRLDQRAAVAQANADQAQRRWAEIAGDLPPAIGLENLDVGPAHPTGRRRSPAAVRLMALGAGTDQGWFTYLSPTEAGYLVEVPAAGRDPIRRELVPAKVLPWVEGFGCWHRKDRLVTFR